MEWGRLGAGGHVERKQVLTFISVAKVLLVVLEVTGKPGEGSALEREILNLLVSRKLCM